MPKTIASATFHSPAGAMTLDEWLRYRDAETQRMMAECAEQFNEFVAQQNRLALLDPDGETEH